MKKKSLSKMGKKWVNFFIMISIVTISSFGNAYGQNTVSGTVFNDIDGSAKGTYTNIQTGAETGTNGNGTLWVYVATTSDNILARGSVAADGTYTTSTYNAAINSTVFLFLDTLTRAIGTNIGAYATIKMPAAWANTSPYMTANIATGGGNLTNQNFGIQKNGFLTIPDFSTCAGSDSLFTWYFRGAATTLVNGTTIVENSGNSLKIPFLKVTARYFTNNVSYSTGNTPDLYPPVSYTVAGAGGIEPISAALEYRNRILELDGASLANGVNNDSIGISVAFKNTNGQKMYIQKLNNAVLDLDTYESLKVIGYNNGTEVRPIIYVSNGYADNTTNDMRSFYMGNKAWIFGVSSGFQSPDPCNAWCDYNYNAVAIMEFPIPVDSIFYTARITEPTGHRSYSASAVGSNEITSFKYCPVTITGNLWNDVNGNGIIDGSEANVLNSGSYINMVDEYGRVLATAQIQPDGSYTFPNLPQLATTTPMKLQISPTQGTIGSLPPITGTPSGYGSVSENPGGGSPETLPFANMEILLPITLGTNLTQQNFGIQRLPESAVNSQVIGLNPGGTTNVTINPNWFATSNVGANPNTQDYDGGTVDSIRITSFPTNANSITIGTTTYYPNAGSIPGTCPTAICLPWPSGGVKILAPGGVPSLPITVDPVDGLVNVVIPFVAIDNAGKEDLTPGSVTITFTSILPIKLISFVANPKGNAVELTWVVATETNVNHYEVEYSMNGINYNSVGIKAASNSRNYIFLHATPNQGLTYYRLKVIDKDGSISYSEVRKVNIGVVVAAIKIYPIPAVNSINITVTNGMINQTAIISLFGIDGKLVYQQIKTVLSQTETIDISKLATGKYIVQIVTNKEVINKRMQVIK